MIVVVIGYKVLSVRREPDEKPAAEPHAVPRRRRARRPPPRAGAAAGRCSSRRSSRSCCRSTGCSSPSRQDGRGRGLRRAGRRTRARRSSPTTRWRRTTTAKSLQCANCHGADAERRLRHLHDHAATRRATPSRPVQVDLAGTGAQHVCTASTSAPRDFDARDCTGRAGHRSSPTGGRARRCRRGASRAAARRTSRPSATSSRTSKSIQLSPAKAPRQQVARATSKALKDQAEAARSTTPRTTLDRGEGATSPTRDDRRRRLAAVPTRSTAAPEALDAISAVVARDVANASQGELLFDVNCARCHTKGWSYLDPPDASVPLPAPPGERRVRPVAARRRDARAVPRRHRPAATPSTNPASRASTTGSRSASRPTRATACAASRRPHAALRQTS